MNWYNIQVYNKTYLFIGAIIGTTAAFLDANKKFTTLWEKYLEKFCPEKYDRIELIRWIATLVCCPWIRMLYSLLLISEQQGIGKSILGQRIISPMIVSAWFRCVGIT